MAMKCPALFACLLLAIAAAQPANAAFDSAALNEKKPLEIVRVTPDGDDVPTGNQIVIQFNRAVVPVGEMARSSADIPVTITPALPCEWRWINSSALACNLPSDTPLTAATRYELEIRPGITTEDGTTITSAVQHSFITERPRVRYKDFRFWKAPGHPVIRLAFNQPVAKDSVERNIYLAHGANFGMRQALKARPDTEDGEAPTFMPIPGDKGAMAFTGTAPRKPDADVRRDKNREARRVWLVEPTRELPLDALAILRVEPGIASAIGPEFGHEPEDIVQFHTYPAFRFLGVSCRDNQSNPLFVAAGTDATGKCNPMDTIALNFSAPVERRMVGDTVAFTPPIGGWASDPSDLSYLDAPEEGRVGYEYRRPHEKDRRYEVTLPYGLKAAQAYEAVSRAQQMNIFERLWHWLRSLFTRLPPITVEDIFGRPLESGIDAAFATDHRNPNYVLDYTDAVLEKGVDSEVPLYVNNLHNFTFAYRRLTTKGLDENMTYVTEVPEVLDVQFAVPFGVREMLGGRSGAMFGYLSTSPAVPGIGPPPRLFAQVTPYAAHLKLGHFASIVWVTDMATGAPVEGAKVSLYVDAMHTLGPVTDATATARTDAEGVATLPGTERIDPELTLTREYGDDKKRYFVRIEKGEDMALLPVSGMYEIDPYRSTGTEWFYPNNRERYGHMSAWGTTAQGIYRAGDTIQYKLFVRNQDNDRFIAPPREGYRLKIIDPMGKVVHTEDAVSLSPHGGYSGEFTVPKEGAVGWYQFRLIADFAAKPEADPREDGEIVDEAAGEDDGSDANLSWIALRVMVSDFTPSAFKVTNQLAGDLFRADEKVSVTTRAELHSGGAYTDASTRVTALLDSAQFVSKHPLASGFQFDSYVGESGSQQLYQEVGTVDGKGELALEFTTGTPNIVYGKLTVESAVADDRGKYVANQTRADYVGVDRLVGLKSRAWVHSVGSPAVFDHLTVDERGVPAAGTPVAITIEHQSTKVARVKGAGNAYLNQYSNEWVAAGSCTGTSQASAGECSFTPTKPGTYRVIARIKDSKAREHSTTLTTYVTGADHVVWNDENDSGLTLVPERTDYKVGDTARYLVKNPYPGAKALITIERYGVIDRFVKTFDTSTPVVEFEVKPDYLPGYYLSVVVTSPRADKPLGEGQVDLGKPAYRMGYVRVPVKDPYKEITVTATADREVYKPRDMVTVKLNAQPRNKAKKEPIELTVAVLDESVLDLVPGGRSVFDIYSGFYKLEHLDLRNYTLLSRLIGRQKFEKKGANPGGDGGADVSMRSLFKFVSYWNGALMTDANGNATIRFEAPDNLTGWRVLAIATTPSDRFGLGEANFKVNRPTEVRPVMPNQVGEGDRFDAGFAVMNRTNTAREITVTITAEGNFDAEKTPPSITKTLSLAPYKREVVHMPIATTALKQSRSVAEGEVRFTVTAGDATDSDGMVHTVPVKKIRSLNVGANYGTTTGAKVTDTIAFPEAMLPDVGSLSVVLSASVIGNIEGAFTYLRDYPYLCWEQRLSKGVMAAHFTQLKGYLPATLQWPASAKLPQETLDMAGNFQTPSGGMAYFRAEDQYADPYLSAYTALAFNWLKKDGYKVPAAVETKLHDYLANMLKNDAVPDFYSEGMTSTVRAVALAALAENGRVGLADIERYAPHAKNMSLFGKAHLLRAALAVKGAESFAPTIAKQILASSNATGGKLVFNETLDDSYARILASPLRENCAVLDALTAYGERTDGASMVGDIPFKLVRSITQSRGNRDHWENTQENLFCLNAFIEYARAYEKETPALRVTATLGEEAIGEAKLAGKRADPVTLDRPNTATDAGTKPTLSIAREGTGRLYYATRLAYALPLELTRPTNAGIEIMREYSVKRDGTWQQLTAPMSVKRGELVRVDLFLSVPAARNFVVVDDAVAGGLEPVNRELATSSQVDAADAEYEAAGGSYWFKYSDWKAFNASRWSFYHQEIRHDAVRFYADYLPPGNYHLSYAAQAIATGEFAARPTRAEEMYDPDVYGTTPGVSLTVGEPEAAAPAAKP